MVLFETGVIANESKYPKLLELDDLLRILRDDEEGKEFKCGKGDEEVCEAEEDAWDPEEDVDKASLFGTAVEKMPPGVTGDDASGAWSGEDSECRCFSRPDE